MAHRLPSLAIPGGTVSEVRARAMLVCAPAFLGGSLSCSVTFVVFRLAHGAALLQDSIISKPEEENVTSPSGDITIP